MPRAPFNLYSPSHWHFIIIMIEPDGLIRFMGVLNMSRIRSMVSVLAPLALLATTGCAQNFNANVSRFQAMPAAQGQTFAIKAGDPKLEGGLEFANYARMVSGKLVSQGYREAAPGEAATLVVSLDYGVDGGKEKLRSVPGYDSFGSCYGYYDPFCGRGSYGFRGAYGYGSPYRWGRGMYYGGWNDSYLFGAGYGDQVESYTVFTSGLEMKIVRVGSSERVFEGKAQAVSLSNNLTYLVPNLVEAMFTGFPGSSGETVRITVPAPAKRRT
jgi:Domain of unknown function (DUF4136)